jgi:hypothetical protein
MDIACSTDGAVLTLRDVAQAALDLDTEGRGAVTWTDLAERAKAWAARRQPRAEQQRRHPASAGAGA